MACFVVPLLEAAAVSAFRKINAKKIDNPDASALMRHVPALEKMLWGGSLMLVVDHIINGELTWAFPFFTALSQEGGLQVVLREMLTVGVPMAAALTAAWAAWALLKEKDRKRVHNIF